MTSLTSKKDAQRIVGQLRERFHNGVTRDIDWRISQLHALRAMLSDNEALFEKALFDDLRKSATEAQLTEIGIIYSDIDYALKHLRSWIKTRRVNVPAAIQPASARIVPEPVGVVLIIAPWNYPLQLMLAPLIGAIAAGNTAVIKPSEISAATSALLAQLVPVYLDNSSIVAVEGQAKETGWLLEQHFDHIFYTGNGKVARIVASAASKNLTPVTLELGGKSPVYIDDSVDLAAAAKRLAWAKFVNAGQTCVAPDYVLGTSEILEKLEQHLQIATRALFGNKPRSSADYGRIINSAHFSRLHAYLDNGHVIAPDKPNHREKYFPPTILTGVSLTDAVMQEEIFGPILPLISVVDAQEAISIISSKASPLALYVFSNNTDVREAFTRNTTSGALVFNAAVIHLSVPGLPFGGVGESGMGSYRGKKSFDTFSHDKPVLSKPLTPETLSFIFPPYTARKRKLIQGLLRKLQ